MAGKIIPWQPDADTDELIRLYVQEHGHAYHVCAAFVMADLEPPRSGGFSGTQSALIQTHYDRYDPNGSRQQNAQIDADLGDV